MSARTLLVRGMIVGAAAGVAAFLFAYLFGEGPINDAIAFEEAHVADHEHGPVSRTVQSTLGLATASIVYGVALGGLFAVAVAVTLGRIGRISARATAGIVALAGFVGVALVPFLKYPANPPATGNGDTLQQRTGLYFLMLVIGVAAVIGAIVVSRSLQPRLGTWNATIAGVLGAVVVVGVAVALLPAVNEVPEGFAPVLLWRFRLASLGTQAVMWATLGLLFGYLTERSERMASVQRAQPVAV
ncbi:CbtA family protein [Dactylosporangium aurantiacum]|uniref:CbtA family protein n=1 Tax=Dactylosporangium aurantiacum TaxID=35754 RepID=A0A9Q9IDC3_9ACTN|nr:CbtA family protein [Dactylosporangium aurantiacum]MDG6106460.1 CbtA family protein [Dactylosporangium aurantiacum]UWZ50505.1 CbtA family protein [Dactylosporangium aurantiacum]